MNINKLLLPLIVLLILTLIGCTPVPRELNTSVTPKGGGTISPESGTFDNGAEVTLIATPAKYYEFDGWAGDVSEYSNRITLKMNSDKNIVAAFRKVNHNVQISVSPSAAGTVSRNSGNYEAGTQLSINATPSKGYRFDHWGGDVTGNSDKVSILVDSDKNITAYFVKQFTLKTVIEPIDAGVIDPVASLYDEGTKVTLNAIPVFPYYPKTWSGTDGTSNPTSVTMDEDKSVEVIFDKTIAGKPHNVCGNLSSGEYKTNPTDSFTVSLEKYEWIQGEIVLGTNTNPPVSANIQDPNGNVIGTFSGNKQGNFSFMAEMAGQYTFTFTNKSIFWSNYDITYSIYHLP
jgi:hypothetical protein